MFFFFLPPVFFFSSLSSARIMRLHPFDSCVTLCGLHDNWVRPPIKPTSAVISTPKSFVIALICILQLSVLAHSKNNQPPLKTGDSIIIISVDLYKTSLTSHCLTRALCCRASFIPYFHIISIRHGRRSVMHSNRAIYARKCSFPSV